MIESVAIHIFLDYHKHSISPNQQWGVYDDKWKASKSRDN